jgi:hypothetical protein
MTPPKANPPELWTGAGVIDKTRLRKSEAELRDEEIAIRNQKLLAILSQETAERERAIGGGNR